VSIWALIEDYVPSALRVSTGGLSCFVGRSHGLIPEADPIVDVGGSGGKSGTTSMLVSDLGSRDEHGTTGGEGRH
jgi:UDP-N-acetylmuramoylalanine-D-glutamate ligase